MLLCYSIITKRRVLLFKMHYRISGVKIMKNFYLLTDALEYMETNILEDFSTQDVADYCHVSLSSLQKLFQHALHMSMKNYVLKRRICLAAKEILTTDRLILDIALRYQFGTAESFIRAFKKVWNETPSQFRKHRKFSEIFPKINYHYKEGEDPHMARKNVDISQAYEFLQEKKGTYVICFDIMGMMQINKISREAGDLAIAEVIKRIDEVSSEEMLAFRIGGDEFALVTGLNETEAEKIGKQVISRNEEEIKWKEHTFCARLRFGLAAVPDKHMRYDSLFTDMHKAIESVRKRERAE